MTRRSATGPEALAGKRFTVRSRDLRWKEGRPKTRRPRPKSPPKPNLRLDLAVAAVASLMTAGVAFCLAIALSGTYGVPLYLAFAVILGGVGVACFMMGPRDRGGRLIACGIGLLWLIGVVGLFAARAEIILSPYRHASAAQTDMADKAED